MKTPVWPPIIALIFLFNISSAQTAAKSTTSVKKAVGQAPAKLICVTITQNNLAVPEMRYKFAYK